MILSKKKLLSLIKENISEMAMDFDTQDRPDQGIQDKLSSQDTPLTKIPFPKTGQEPNKNFQELLASQRYKEVIQNLRRYTGVQNPPLNGLSGIMPLQIMVLNAHNKIVQIENNHREELENLAVELVKKEMSLSEDDVIFDAKITGMGEIDSSDFNKENRPQQNQPEVNIDTNDVEEEEQLMIDLENLDLERAKRRLINTIVQGASKTGHYMYHLVGQELEQITGSNELLNLYGIMMSVNDISYWQVSDQAIRGAGDSVAGKVEVLDPEDGEEGDEEGEEGSGAFKIVARGINFPVLVHELIKGVMELIGKHGSPEDDEMFRQVQQHEDTLQKEIWDLRLGPSIWAIIRSQFPENILTDENKRKIQRFLLMNIFKLPARKMLILNKEVLSKSETGRELLQEMVNVIEDSLNNENYEEAMQIFNSHLDDVDEKTDDDDFDDFLGRLGITRPQDD